MCVGADDPIVPLEERIVFEEEMRAADVDWGMYVYGGVGHSFTNLQAGSRGRPGLEFNELATQRPWRAMTDHFAEVL